MKRFKNWLLRYGGFAILFWIPFFIKNPYLKWEWLGLVWSARLIMFLLTCVVFWWIHILAMKLYSGIQKLVSLWRN